MANEPTSSESSGTPNKTWLETALKMCTDSRCTSRITGITKNGVLMDPTSPILASTPDVIEITGEMSYQTE